MVEQTCKNTDDIPHTNAGFASDLVNGKRLPCLAGFRQRASGLEVMAVD